MKEEKLENGQEGGMNNSSNFRKLRGVLKKAISSPYIVVGTILSIAGVSAIIVAGAKVATANREVKALTAENVKLGKQLNEAWYQLGKAAANK